jgi:hypothetical protein
MRLWLCTRLNCFNEHSKMLEEQNTQLERLTAENRRLWKIVDILRKSLRREKENSRLANIKRDEASYKLDEMLDDE